MDIRNGWCLADPELFGLIEFVLDGEERDIGASVADLRGI
jgi:hypothetical protein